MLSTKEARGSDGRWLPKATARLNTQSVKPSFLSVSTRAFPLSTKKCTTWEPRVKLYLGQHEECCPGDGSSDSSERLLQWGRGMDEMYVILGRRSPCSQALIFVEGFSWSRETSLSHEKQSSPWRISVLFRYEELQRIGLIKSAPEKI